MLGSGGVTHRREEAAGLPPDNVVTSSDCEQGGSDASWAFVLLCPVALSNAQLLGLCFQPSWSPFLAISWNPGKARLQV